MSLDKQVTNPKYAFFFKNFDAHVVRTVRSLSHYTIKSLPRGRKHYGLEVMVAWVSLVKPYGKVEGASECHLVPWTMDLDRVN